MTFIFKHPSLTALELLWRWLAAVPLGYLAWRTLAPTLAAIPLDTAALQSMTFFEPVRSAAVLARQMEPFVSPVANVGRWWVPLALGVWAVAAALGRSAVLRRADPSARPNPLRLAGPSFLRAVLFLLLLGCWALVIWTAVRATVTHPLYLGQEPSLVLLTAAAVLITFVAFMLWSLSIWALDLWPLRTTAALSLSTPQRKALRSKLIETNLVMGIVRVILLVLALTFSASPLPFQSRETQAFINVWWVAVAAFYILGSDFFHVVRRVTYLRLLQSIATPTNAEPSNAS